MLSQPTHYITKYHCLFGDIKPHTQSAELGLVNYNVYRMDRESTGSTLSRAGEVLVAVSKHLNSFIITIDSTSIEQVFVGITHEALKIII